MTVLSHSSSTTPAVDLDAWLSLGVHRVTLPTGAVVRLRLPDLSTLVARRMVPDELRSIAQQAFLRDVKLETGNPEAPLAEDKLAELYDLNCWLVSDMLVEPSISPDQVRLLPAEDLEWLILLAQRDVDTDALGVRLGVAPVDRFPADGELSGGPSVGPASESGDPDGVGGVPV